MFMVEGPDFAVFSLGDGRLKVASKGAVIVIPAVSVENFCRAVKVIADVAEEEGFSLRSVESTA